MSWSFVGSVTPVAGTTNFVSSTTTATVSLPAGVQGGDLVIVDMCYAPTTAPGSVSIPGFTSREAFAGGAKSSNFGDFAAVLYKAAGGSTGSATTDTSYTATFTSASFGEFVTYVLRPSLGGFTVIGSAHYNGNSASSYLAACPDPTYTPTSASNAIVWGYAGQNSTVGTTATTFSGTGVTALSNFAQGGLTANGGGVGIGWLQSTSAPGGATASQLVDATDFVIEFAEVSSAPLPGPPPQQGGQTWRRKNRRHQSPVAPMTVLTVTAGLATGTGAAADFSTGLSVTIGVNATLAAGTGAAGSPVVTDAVNAGLASGTGTSQSPTVTLTVNAGLATGTGTAQSPLNSATIPSGLATGTGTSQSPTASLKVNAGLATGTGTSQSPSVSLTVNAGLATGTGTAQSPVASITVNAGLATGTGTAFGPTVPTASFAGLATGTGTALSPTVTLTVNAGLATGTGTAFAPGTSSRTIGLATSTGTSQQPTVSLTVTAGLATGTGTAFGPTAPRTAGLATGTGAAGSPVVTIAVNATLAHGTGTAQSPSVPITVTAGLATGTGSAFTPTAPRTAGLATGTGTAFDISVAARKNVDFTGSTLSAANTLGGTLTIATLDGTLTVAANTLGGTASVASNLLGGTVTIATLGGTAAVTSDTLTGTLSVATNTLSGTAAEDKMQEVDIILNEFNDATVTFQILNNGTPYNITGMTVNALFKKTRGDLDSAGTTKTYSSGGGSPAITIVTPTTGSCTLAIPDGDITTGTVWSFYRIDVVSGTVTTTSIFGTVTITLL